MNFKSVILFEYYTEVRSYSFTTLYLAFFDLYFNFGYQ